MSDRTNRKSKSQVSRRDFLAKSAIGAGAAAALGAANPAPAAAGDVAPNMAPIRVAEQFTKSIGEAPISLEFGPEGLTGSQVFARACKEEGLAALFCCPGNYTMINAISAVGIPAYGGRIEDIMCAAADGFSRVTGEVAATSGTEGPGFTNMIMSIASADRAHSPILVLASNMAMSNEDRIGGIQQMYQQPTTEGIKKYGKRITIPNRIHEYAQHAFRQLKTGVPGPVHLDFPSEVHGARFKDASELKDFWEKAKYRTECVAHPAAKDVARAVDLIQKAERPMIVAGQGVFFHKGWEALKLVAEKNDIAVVESGPVRGHFGDEHRLSANLAPDALGSVDLVIFIGQYLMPNVGEYRFNPDVKAIRIHPVADDLGRNWPLDLGLVADEKAALEALAEALPKRQRAPWAAEIAAARKKFDDQNDEYYGLAVKYSQQTGVVHPGAVGKILGDFLYRGSIPKEQTTFAQGGWTGASWTRRWIRAYRPGQVNNCPYQYYPIGPDVGHLLGAGAAMQLGTGPQKAYQGAPVFGFTGDAGVAYSVMEFDTLTKYRIPAVMTVYNNNAWGMITAANGPRSHHMYMFQENLRYDKVAEALGARGEYVTTPEQYQAALGRAYEAASKEKISTLINVQSSRDFLSSQAFPPGTPRNVEPGATAYMH
jgi:thiamine pyrophosphate-dependent acetolactate synthase large subunit-like protein